jgi:hypothetical protein
MMPRPLIVRGSRIHRVASYWHVYMDGEQFKTAVPGLHPIESFAHYVGPDIARFAHIAGARTSAWVISCDCE